MNQIDGRLIIDNNRIESYKKMESLNPATLKPVGIFDLASSEQCNLAIESSKNVFPMWRNMPFPEKRKIFLKAKGILLKQKDMLAQLITAEKGSPLSESYSNEIMGGMEVIDYYSNNTFDRLKPKKVNHQVTFLSHKKGAFHSTPLGVSLIITPWNYPFIIPLYEIMASLSAGNTVILKPSLTTALVALSIGDIFIKAGLPPGVLNIVNCEIPQAEEMTTNPAVQVILFTGSVRTGKRIMELASRNITNLVLELGGKDPMIVCPDTDIERAVHGAVWGAFTNCGQSCGSIERIYVHQSIYEEFTQRVISLAKKLRVGNPINPEIDIGPMATFEQRSIVEDHLENAKSKGAVIHLGGNKIDDLQGYFIRPAVLTSVNHSMKIMTEETFGPVCPIMDYSHIDQAVDLANDCKFGLTASIWTRNRKTAHHLADRIEAGSITINDHLYSFSEPNAIWGGIKQSGINRSHGESSFNNLVNKKYIGMDFKQNKKQFWWFPYGKNKNNILTKAMSFFHHNKRRKRISALIKLLPSLTNILKETPLSNFIKNLPRSLKK